MKAVNPMDRMRHHPVKLICNCVLKAYLIMHLHKATELKPHWQLSFVTFMLSYCSFGREGCEYPCVQILKVQSHEKKNNFSPTW